ncbi:MAG TPA: glycosyltransferase family 2 protein, partial [Candidatus Hydrogenedentes bacterium]|nr:glycosyltransferase family 2 protein [Candidatus Hydrogenedentota bacterium]
GDFGIAMMSLGDVEEPASCPIAEGPLVTVVLSSYNYADFLGQALDSVFEQTYRPIELVVVDDGSSDRSREIIEEKLRSASIPATPVFQENRGQAAALNAGFALAKGRYICTLDSDDYWSRDKVARMAAFAERLPDGGVYQHQLARHSGGVDKPLLLSGDLAAIWRTLGTVNLALRQDVFSVFVPTSGLMWRTAVLRDIGPIPSALRACPDAYLTRMACLRGPLYSNPEALGTWRDHERNAGRKDRYGFDKFWLRVIMPVLNEAFAREGEPVRLVYRPAAVVMEPWRLVREALSRHRARKAKRSADRE